MNVNWIARRTGVLDLGAGAMIAASSLTACSSHVTENPVASAPTSSVLAMPAAANFIADMPAGGGSAMTTMAVTVEGDNVVAYTTNGTNDEAYFFGTQKGGRMDLTSMYADHLTASYDGATIGGELTMNENGATAQKFTASRVAAPAGLYTAAEGNHRATWVVRPDRSTVGVMDNSAPGDHKVTDAINTQDKQFMDSVRQMRLNRQMQQAPKMTVGSREVAMGGATVAVVPVTGSMTF